MSPRIAERRSAEARAAQWRAQLAQRGGDAIARHNLAFELRAVGHAAEALAAITPAATAPGARVETRLLFGHLLTDLGRYDEAVAVYRALIANDPGAIDAHATLARLLPQMGQGATALDCYRTALKRASDNGLLWVSALQAARDLREPAQLLDWAEAAERRFGADTMLTVYAAQALGDLGEHERALALLSRAVASEPDYVPALTTYAFALLRAGDARAAETHALRATALEPDGQIAWSLLTIIWRVLGDAREAWLADYERLVVPCDLDVDLPALVSRLRALHDTSAQPADQSLRGGTQTRGDLHRHAEPELLALLDAIERGVAARLRALPRDDTHPFLRRNRGAIAFAGSWSVRLATRGFHVSHIHPAGWLSSALHVALPEGLDAASGEGALVFGVPDEGLGLALPPRRTIAPTAGRLILFPSYFWHGTRAFDRPADRLTVAFDALPVDTPAPAR